MKRLLLLLPFLAFAVSAAEVTGPASCRLAWDYSAEDQARIDGFRFFLNGKKAHETGPAVRQIACKDLAPINGENTVYAIAYAGADVSPNSNSLAFRYSSLPLAAPGKTRLVIVFPEPPK